MKQLLKQRELLLLVIIALLVGLFASRAPGFASVGNLAGIFNDTSILIIIALGQMAVILTKSIDLSVAANLAFTGMAVAMLNATYPGLPLVLLIVLAIGIGAVLGAINGILVWKLNIPAIVVTLGTLTIYRGMAFVLSGGAWVNAHQMTAPFLNTPRTPFLGLPLLGWTAILIVALVYVLLTRTFFGRALLPPAAIRPPPSIPALMLAARASSPLCFRARWPDFAVISGCRAMPSPMWMWPPGSNSTVLRPASSAAFRYLAESARWPVRFWARCFLASSKTLCRSSTYHPSGKWRFPVQ